MNSPDVMAGSPAISRLLRAFQPSNIVWLALILILVVLVVAPISKLIIASLTEPRTGEWTVANYFAAYERARYVTALVNTLIMGAAVVGVSLVFAVPLAWACSCTDMPGRNAVRLMVLGAFIMPPYLGAVGWVLLAGPNSGWINRTFSQLSGYSEPLFNIFSFSGIVLVMSINLFFFLFVFTSTALEMVSSEMEEAANILGAGKLKTAFAITIPLIMPSIVAGSIITFLQSIALFGVPGLLSVPARFPVVVTQLFEFFQWPARVEVAAAYSVALLVITVLAIAVQRALLSRGNYTSVSGKGGARTMVKLGAWRWVMLSYALFIGAISFFLPLAVLIQASFSRAWGRGITPGNLTLENFVQVFSASQSSQTLMNSLLFAAAAATLAVILAIGIAYIIRRHLVPFGGFLQFLCMAPLVIPGIVLAIGFYATYAGPPAYLYGTAAIMVLAFTTRFLPIAYSTSDAGMRSFNPEMEEAVRILGAGRIKALTSVVIPLLKRTMFGAWILIFIPAAQELSTAIFLIGPNTRVVSVLILDLTEEGRLEQVSALGVVLLLVMIAIVSLGMAALGRNFMLRRT